MKNPPPISWRRIERVMVRVMSGARVTVRDMNLLTRAFRLDQTKYDAARARAQKKVEKDDADTE